MSPDGGRTAGEDSAYIIDGNRPASAVSIDSGPQAETGGGRVAVPVGGAEATADKVFTTAVPLEQF